MTFGDRKAWFEGDACEGAGCAHLLVKHRAEHHGYCLSCWAGSTEPQRRLAAFGDGDAVELPDPFAYWRMADERALLASLEAIWDVRA